MKWEKTYFDVTTFSRVSSGALTGKAANMIGALAIIQTWIRFTFVVFKITQFTGKTCSNEKIWKSSSQFYQKCIDQIKQSTANREQRICVNYDLQLKANCSDTHTLPFHGCIQFFDQFDRFETIISSSTILVTEERIKIGHNFRTNSIAGRSIVCIQH